MIKKYPDFWTTLITDHPGFLFGYAAISVIAAFGIILVMASMKYKAVSGSPEKWSWRYFLANNAGNFLASLFVMPIFMRLFVQFVHDPGIMLFVSVGCGFGFYKLANLANNVGIWTTDAVSKKIADQINNKP